MKLLIESINTILYHNTSVNNIDNILRDGLLVSRSNSEDASNYKCIWATDRPLRLEYGGVTLQINLPDDIRYEEDEGYYLIYDDIPPQYIKIIDYPLFKEKLSYKLSDIRNLMDKYPKEKIKQLILTYKNDLIFDLEKTKQLTNFLDWSIKEDIDNKIPSKFDKWLGYDFGGIRTFAKGLEFKDTPDNWYYYEETWNFIGRRSDGRYYFECTFSYDEDMIGKILSFPRFNDVAYMVALPGRN